MRFRYLKDGTQRERSCQFSFSSAKRFLVSLLFPFTNVLLAQPVDTTSIFPLNTGDWTELEGFSRAYYNSFNPPAEYGPMISIVREVLGDTVMDNSLVYKVVRWKYMTISIHTPQPWYQYLRKDAQNKIWGWGMNEDSLIYDFSQLYFGYSWQVGKSNPDGSYYSKTIVSNWKDILFGNIRNFYLIQTCYYSPTATILGFETFVEGYGVIQTKGSFINNQDTTFVIADIWGAIIGKRRDGIMLAGIDNILDIYPLNVGDSWHYRSNFSSYQDYSRIVSITCDTVFSDGIHYKGTLEKLIHDIPSAGQNTTDYYYQRIDTQGNVYSVRFDGKNWIPQRDYRFSFALGDTFVASRAYDPVIRMNFVADKHRSLNTLDTLANYLYLEEPNNPNRYDRTFSLGWGKHSIGLEIYSEGLVGARVNGKTWGNLTYLMHIENESRSHPFSIQLAGYPNPFNGSITLNIAIDRGAYSTIRIYNVLGQEISVVCSEYFSIGQHRIVWSPENIPSGPYVAVLSTGTKISITKIIYLK